jgi:NAD-dependent SIR2 family protein deacetylase
LKKYNLPYPEAVFDIDFYQRNPIPFCSLAAEIWPGLKHKPTLTHSFVGLLASRDLLLRNYSQNIDGLEYLADIPAEKLVECHGHFRTASCVQCRKAADGQAVKETIVQHAKAPVCKHCTGYVKPDIVFFGEGLPHKFHNSLKKDLRVADMVLILGTSLNVAPVSMIPEMVEGNCKRVLLNRELVGDLDLDDSDRDLFYAGDCDDAIQKLADLLDWREDLQEWHARVQGSIHPGADASD